MSARARAWLGWGLVGLGISTVPATFPFLIADNRVFPGYLNPSGIVIEVVLILWLAAGATIISRQPGNWAGWIFCVVGFIGPFAISAQSIALYGLKVNPGAVPFVGVIAWVAEFGLYPFALMPLLFLLFPDGNPPSPRWRWAIIGLLAGTGIAFLGYLVRPGPFNNLRDYVPHYQNPLGVEALRTIADVVIEMGAIIAVTCGFLSIFALRGRFKRSEGDERQRMRSPSRRSRSASPPPTAWRSSGTGSTTSTS